MYIRDNTKCSYLLPHLGRALARDTIFGPPAPQPSPGRGGNCVLPSLLLLPNPPKPPPQSRLNFCCHQESHGFNCYALHRA